MKGADSLAAGFVLIGVAAVITVAGVIVGGMLGSRLAGGMAGGAIGLVMGFRTVYRLYLVPLRDQMEKHDYSHLEPKLGPDD